MSKIDYLLQCQRIAENHGGVCLSNKYVNDRTKLKFRCKRGHVFLAKSSHIRGKRGQWCPLCFALKKGNVESIKL